MQRKQGFTLIECLVVIALVGLLIGLSLPALASVRQRARVQTCLVNLRSLHQTVEMYRNDFKLYPFADSIANIVIGNVEPFKGLEPYQTSPFPFVKDYTVHSGSPWQCPSDNESIMGFSYIYGPFDLMAAWGDGFPQRSVSFVLENTPKEILFMDSSTRHTIRGSTYETVYVRCDGSMGSRTTVPNR